MATTPNLTPSQPAAHAHLAILQGVISRMASSSHSCKTWCITIIAAIFIVAINTEINYLALVALAPAALFCLLDIYYLGLERAFRQSYNDFVAALHGGTLDERSLFSVQPTHSEFTSRRSCFASPSILPFYPTLAIIAVVISIALSLLD